MVAEDAEVVGKSLDVTDPSRRNSSDPALVTKTVPD